MGWSPFQAGAGIQRTATYPPSGPAPPRTVTANPRRRKPSPIRTSNCCQLKLATLAGESPRTSSKSWVDRDRFTNDTAAPIKKANGLAAFLWHAPLPRHRESAISALGDDLIGVLQRFGENLDSRIAGGDKPSDIRGGTAKRPFPAFFSVSIDSLYISPAPLKELIM
jgi:hypothetical protein